MTISSISDLLAVGWTHAYCTEGPEFLAANPASSGGGGLVAGPISLTPGTPAVTPISNWPDEVGTADLAQASAGLQPTLVAADTDLNGKPSVSFDGFDDLMKVAFGSSMTLPVDVIMIGHIHNLNGNRTMLDGSSVRKRLAYQISSTPDVYVIQPAACASPNFATTLTGGLPDLVGHMWRYRMQSFTALFAVDGVSAIAGNAANTMCNLEGITVGNGFAGTASAAIDVAFVGCYPGVLSAGQLSDLLAFSQSHYGTP